MHSLANVAHSSEDRVSSEIKRLVGFLLSSDLVIVRRSINGIDDTIKTGAVLMPATPAPHRLIVRP